jgi:hypothetical protein
VEQARFELATILGAIYRKPFPRLAILRHSAYLRGFRVPAFAVFATLRQEKFDRNLTTVSQSQA